MQNKAIINSFFKEDYFVNRFEKYIGSSVSDIKLNSCSENIGGHNEVYEIYLGFKSDDEIISLPLFVKFYDKDFIPRACKNERNNSEILKKAGLNSPDFVFGKKISSDTCFNVFSKIDGTPSTRIFNNKNFKNVDINPLLRDMSEYMARLHLYKKYKEPDIDYQDSKEVFAKTLIKSIDVKYMKNLDKENIIDRNWFLRKLKQHESIINTDFYAYNHQDFELKHYFIDKNLRVSGIVDGEFAKVTDPINDLGILIHDFNRAIEDKELKEQYISEIIRNYRSKTNFKNIEEKIPFFLVKQALRHASAGHLRSKEYRDAKSEINMAKKYIEGVIII